MPFVGHGVGSSFRPTPAARSTRFRRSFSVGSFVLLPARYLNPASSGPIRAAMRRPFPLLLAGLICSCSAGVASELTLTGLTRSQGRVRAYISTAQGSVSVTLSLNEERAGIKFEAVDFRLRRAWVSEGGSTRCLILGGTNPDAHGPGSQFGAEVSAAAQRIPGAAETGSRAGSGPVHDSLPRPGGSIAVPLSDESPAHQDGVGSSVTNNEGGNVTNPPHRWVPGVVREPTEDEIFRAKYGQAAWEERKRFSDHVNALRQVP